MSATALARIGNIDGPPQYYSVAELCRTSVAVLEAWLDDQQSLYPATPRDAAAAFFFGALTWGLCEAIAKRWLETGTAPSLSADPLRLAMTWEHWQEDGAEGDHIVCRFDSLWTESGPDAEADHVADLAQALRLQLDPLVATLSQRAGLPASALWRLLGDAIGGAFIDVAQGDNLAAALAAAQALLAASTAPIANKQMKIEELALPSERHPRGEAYRRWFRKRGGCCRYYKVDGGDYCTTCVLRDDASRQERLLDYMERQCRIAPPA